MYIIVDMAWRRYCIYVFYCILNCSETAQPLQQLPVVLRSWDPLSRPRLARLPLDTAGPGRTVPGGTSRVTTRRMEEVWIQASQWRVEVEQRRLWMSHSVETACLIGLWVKTRALDPWTWTDSSIWDVNLLWFGAWGFDLLKLGGPCRFAHGQF